MWGKPVTIARVMGFDIKIDASWLLIASLIVWSLATNFYPVELPGTDLGTLLIMSVISMLTLFASLILHELAHAIVARHYGLRIIGITLFLFGGVAELQSEPVSSGSEFWIAIAGPVASIVLAAVFGACGQLAFQMDLPQPVQLVFGYLATINLVLALFNLLPAFPMDGGRILRAWLWARSGDLHGATRKAATVSTGFAYAFVALGLVAVFNGAQAAGLWPVLIGLFLLAASRNALFRNESATALHGRTVADLMTRYPKTAHPGQSLSDLVNRVFLRHSITFAPVVEDGILLGYVDLHLVGKIDREHWATTTVDDVIENAGPANTVAPGLPAQGLLDLVSQTGQRKFIVAEEQRLLGVVTLTDLLAHLRVAREIRRLAPPSIGKSPLDLPS
jgi:Zn-dependent protease/predicted transcriptional regulator